MSESSNISSNTSFALNSTGPSVGPFKMILVTIIALLAVCSADKLDRTYLPPPSAKSAGGSPGSLQTPLETKSFNQGLGGIPQGGFSNENDGVVVEAAAAGTRSSESGVSGLGAPRINYGSINSKVGESAFKVAQQQQPFEGSFEAQRPVNQQSSGQGSFFGSFGQSNNFQSFGSAPRKAERAQAAAERAAGTVKFESAVDTDKFSYAFQTDNGISAQQNGVDNNGIQSQGGFSYTGDDGQVYSVTYTADEGGYKPQGSHLPTAPPIPEEILKSLEKNAADEAAGIIDDGSYDAQKYNAGGEYREGENNSAKYKGQDGFGNRRESVTASGSFNQNTFTQPEQSAQFQSSGQASFSFNSQSGAANQIAPTSNDLRPALAYNEQSNQLSSNNKPLTSFSPQAPTFSSNAQFGAKGESNAQLPNLSSFGNAGLFNANSNKNIPAFGNNFSSQQNSEITGLSNPINTESNSITFNSNAPKNQQSSNGLSLNNEYLPPSNSFLFNSNKAQNALFSQRNPSQNIAHTSLSNPTRRPSSQFNSYEQNSANAQTELFADNGKPALLNFGSANVNNRFEYQNITKPTTPVNISPSLSSNSGQSSFNLPESHPIDFISKPQIPQFSSSFSSSEVSESKDQNTQKQNNEFPSTSASASATIDLNALIPGFKQPNLYNEERMPSNQLNYNSQMIGKPSIDIENNIDKISENQVYGTAQASFGQISQYQDKNDAYYYNQPGQQFKTPYQNRPSASSQFNQIFQQNSLSSASQNIPINGFFNQSPSTTVTYPSPQTAAPTVPTSATQNDLGLNNMPLFSGLTQATASSFVSNVPSQSFDNQPSTAQSFTQTTRLSSQPSRPSFGQGPTSAVPAFLQQSLNTPNVTLNMIPVSTQQYNGELYQYSKPPQTADSHADSEEHLQFQSSPTKVDASTAGIQSQFGVRPVFNQQSQGEIYDYKKPPQVFPAPTETEKQESNGPSKDESPISEAQSQIGPASSQPAKTTNSISRISDNKGFDGSSIKPVCCKSAPSPASFSSTASATISSQAAPGFGFQGTQSSSQAVPGRGETFNAFRNPPSYDPETGYHY